MEYLCQESKIKTKEFLVWVTSGKGDFELSLKVNICIMQLSSSLP